MPSVSRIACVLGLLVMPFFTACSSNGSRSKYADDLPLIDPLSAWYDENQLIEVSTAMDRALIAQVIARYKSHQSSNSLDQFIPPGFPPVIPPGLPPGPPPGLPPGPPPGLPPGPPPGLPPGPPNGPPPGHPNPPGPHNPPHGPPSPPPGHNP